MRITFVLPGYPWKPVGGFRVVYEYANYLTMRGHGVSVVHARWLGNLSPPSWQTPYRRLRWEGWALRNRLITPEVRWQPIDPRVQLIYVPELTSRYLPDADAIFATAWQTAEYVNDYPSSKGEKFYLIQSFETWSGSKARVDATWKMPLHKVVIAGWLYDLGTQMGCRDMVKIPNALDHSRFKLSTPVPDRRKRVSMMFSHQELKGSADGLTALRIAKSECPDLEAVFFGVSPRPRSLPAWIEYRQNPSQRELIENIYNSSCIFVCPSWTEGFALPPAEAMACGCAVASTDCGGVREFSEHGATALFSAPKDPEVLARNILRLLEDDDLRTRIALEGHKRIQAFTWERSTDLLEEFIQVRVNHGPHADSREASLGTTCAGSGSNSSGRQIAKSFHRR